MNMFYKRASMNQLGPTKLSQLGFSQSILGTFNTFSSMCFSQHKFCSLCDSVFTRSSFDFTDISFSSESKDQKKLIN